MVNSVKRVVKGLQLRNGILIYCVIFFCFLICWSLLTIIILILQDKLLGNVDDRPSIRPPDDDSYMGHGIQVVVGHYSGNLPAEKRENLTDDELNANNWNPVPGMGESGRGVNLNVKEELESERTFGINQFNLWISDRLALNRSLPDIRKPACVSKAYPPASDLPTTSVIIVYHNEAYSTLLRTVVSVINRSPKEALAEIILVDDFSTRTFLNDELDNAVKNLPVRVKILRAQKRIGLIRARLMGAAEAAADVLTFLDSHCECTEGWLEPLLARIKENRKAVVCPIIDVINDRTFAYQKGIEMFYGAFSWGLQFRWYAVPPSVAKKRANDPTAPIASPAMAGGLFSIDRRYFEELGTYDAKMDIWGGENIEISFRIWQCGGRVEILPCSHVGHIFRKASPHDFPNGKKSISILNGNLVRVAEVWMDEWKYLFYKTSPQALNISKTIDVSDRVELRKRLHCKDFRWYLTNVWPQHFLPFPGSFFGRLMHKNICLRYKLNSVSGVGKIPVLSSKECERLNETSPFTGVTHTEIAYDFQSHMDTKPCLVSRPGEVGKRRHRLTFSQCSLGFDMWQLWIYTKEGQIKSDEHQCLSASTRGLAASGATATNPNDWTVQLKECGEHEMEFWNYNSKSQKLVHKQSGFCLDQPINDADKKASSDRVLLLTGEKDFLTSIPSLQPCVRGKPSQRWHFTPVSWLPNEF